MQTFKVGYFVGSLSSTSINRKLALALTKLAPPELVMREIGFRDLPLYSPDYDPDYPPVARARLRMPLPRWMPFCSSRRSTIAPSQVL